MPLSCELSPERWLPPTTTATAMRWGTCPFGVCAGWENPVAAVHGLAAPGGLPLICSIPIVPTVMHCVFEGYVDQTIVSKSLVHYNLSYNGVVLRLSVVQSLSAHLLES